MTIQVSINEAQKRWSELIDAVIAGEEIAITIAEHPVVRMLPNGKGSRSS